MDSPGDWRWRAGCPRQSWLRTVEADLRPMNLGLAIAKRRAQDRSAWRLLVATATSSTSSWRGEEEHIVVPPRWLLSESWPQSKHWRLTGAQISHERAWAHAPHSCSVGGSPPPFTQLNHLSTDSSAVDPDSQEAVCWATWPTQILGILVRREIQFSRSRFLVDSRESR